jgi:iron(III) transport system permease protein
MLASVSIFDSATDSAYGYAAAKSVVILGLSVAAMVLVWWIESRSRRSRGEVGVGKGERDFGLAVAAAGA